MGIRTGTTMNGSFFAEIYTFDADIIMMVC